MDQRNLRSLLRIAALIVGLALSFDAMHASSTDPTTALGFVADQVYQFNGIDNVNTFNGNLIVQIPIGKKYTIGDGLTYGFTLSYNSTIWKKEFLNIINGVSESDPLQEITDSGPIPEDVPNRMFNAGLGWLFTLGDLRWVGQEENGGAPALIYTSPDGAEHVLYANLHVTGSTGPLPPDGTIGYTRDGTYMRMKQLSGGRWEIALPDGSRQLFVCGSCASTGHYELTEIHGPLGEVLYVTRDAANNRLVLQETSKTAPVRTHYINYQHLANVPPYDNVVSSIQLEVNDAGTTCPRIATYTFNYTIARILRTPESLLTDPHFLRVPYADATSGTINVPLLTSITMPQGSPSQPLTCGRCDASCPGAATESWSFDYAGYKNAQGAVVDPRIYSGWGPNTARPYDSSFFEGQLTRLTYPTGGSINYVYGNWGYPRRNCASHTFRGGSFEPMWSHSIGIASRQLKDAAGNNDGHPYYYIYGTTHPATSTPGVDFCNLPKEYQVAIVDPVGNVTTHYFSIFMGQGSNPGAGAPATADPFDPLDFGLPFSRFEPDPNQAPGAHTRWISERVYQCQANFFPGDVDLTTIPGVLALHDKALQVASSPSCSRKRSVYRGFERSGDNCLHPTTPLNYSDDGCSAANRRLASMSTFYDDDQPANVRAFKTEAYSDFDGLGHYRTEVIDGNFATLSGTAAAEQRIDTTIYNPGRSTTSIPASGDAWFLEGYTERHSSGAGSAPLRTLFQFAPCAIFVSGDFTAPCGYMTAERKLKNGLTPAPDDLLTTYTRDADSQFIYLDEVHYGGDPRPQESGLNTDENQWVNPGAPPRYRVVHRREYDTHDTWTATSLYASLTGDSHSCATLAVIGSAVLDRPSGLPLSTTDGSGATTSYTFDLQRRLTSVAPQGVTRVTYGYTPFAFPSLPSVAGLGTGFDVGYTYDGFGRLVHERHRTSAALNDQETTYFPTGAVHTKSVVLDPNVSTNGRTTIYDGYDAFDRPQEITPPGAKTTTIAYSGDRERDTTTFVGVDNRPSVRREFFDIQGRLSKVDEDLAPPTTSVQNYQSTFYTYDLLGNIAGVQQGSQSRSFIFDSLGHERSETVPELVPATAGAPSITYDWYDAFGHVGRKVFGPSSPFNVSFDYDPIGRLITVRDAAGRPFKDYEYYGDLRCADAPPALSAGKLRKATRHNNVPVAGSTSTIVDRIISEGFSYDGVNGKLATTTL
ncbi:MAG: hypothetical protein JWN02_2025, partial [Acidobacteria bacterium]|nr:hypothetical protein [Acidobacteriota bacterium]